MNEEIARILQMLEDGRITAEEAERLIRAVRDQGARRHEHRHEWQRLDLPDPILGLRQAVRWVVEAQARAMRRQIRWHWWSAYRKSRREAHERLQRAASMTTAEQVRWLLRERVQINEREPRPESRLADLLADPDPCGWERGERIAWETLRYGLRDEFGIEASDEELRALPTLQALIDFVDARVPPRPATTAAAAEPAASAASTAPPEAAQPAADADAAAVGTAAAEEAARPAGTRKRSEPGTAEPPSPEPGQA